MNQCDDLFSVKVPTGYQHREILSYLRSGNSLTVLEAIEKFGCYALSQRCGAQGLRGMGWPIKSRWKELPNGKKVKEYYL